MTRSYLAPVHPAGIVGDAQWGLEEVTDPDQRLVQLPRSQEPPTPPYSLVLNTCSFTPGQLWGNSVEEVSDLSWIVNKSEMLPVQLFSLSGVKLSRGEAGGDNYERTKTTTVTLAAGSNGSVYF